RLLSAGESDRATSTVTTAATANAISVSGRSGDEDGDSLVTRIARTPRATISMIAAKLLHSGTPKPVKMRRSIPHTAANTMSALRDPILVRPLLFGGRSGRCAWSITA